ncbi:hypothetical protein CTI12_AA028640 [Artemisia annua]|uniref:arginine--tRNA ligase n=1 Tax=Artemisia annua TaxID=35608 RepID=A0A2U1QHL8_ARTAN|nr:hypothetical protein CTI12_AA028640 [Artemisia annua]
MDNFIHSTNNKIMGEFESRKSKMIKRLQLHDPGILTFRLTGRWMAEALKVAREQFTEKQGVIGNSFASLLETRALLRSLVKDYPARNLFALAGIECDLGLYLVKFTEVIERACQAFVPDIVCEYLCNLSKLFTRYYHKVEPGANMLGLCKATEMVLNKCFHLLGIAPRGKLVYIYLLYLKLMLDKFRSRPDGWELFDKEDDCHVSYFKREWHSPVDISNGALVHFENPSSLHSIPFSSPIEVSALVKATSKEKDQTYVICNCKGTQKVSEFWAGDSNIECGTFKIDGEDGHINLHYILLKDALDTTMELMFNHVKTVRVRGTIVAYYGDDIVGDGGFLGQYKALIFEADPSKSIGHKKPHPLPLHKSTLAVPANGSLKIEAHLVDVDSNKAIVNHMKEFRESMSPSIWKMPFGKGSFEFRVNWLHRVQGGSNQIQLNGLNLSPSEWNNELTVLFWCSYTYFSLNFICSELDENLQKAFHKYLEIRGIKPSATNFLNKEYTNWLKNLKKFVEA